MRFVTLITIMVMHFTGISQVLKGTVVDPQKMAIEGALVINVNSGKHAHTEHNGIFILEKVHEGDTLRIQQLGYETSEVIIKNVDKLLFITLKEKTIALDEVTISPKLDATKVLATINLKTNPVNSSQEILRLVPGLVIGQHAGGGKAEQLFLRGFDLDHGTDINITVDGMPVNMVSHAHGQGYADLHFLIPETIDNIDFGKGTYYADKGNFTTAGYVGFTTKSRIDKSMIKLEVGQFNTQRLVGMFDVLNSDKQSIYLASEYRFSDGPFDSPQHFNRLNLMAKYTGTLANHDKLSASVSHFTSRWDASGQIPVRVIDDGSISWFGAIDDTEGGQTSRTSAIVNHTKNINESSYVKTSGYVSYYDFELYSNFTFFLEDSINGDQIKQKERRNLFGIESQFNQTAHLGKSDGLFQVGVGLRNDHVSGVELSHTKNRDTTLQAIQLGDIAETNYFTYVNFKLDRNKWVINPGLRLDYFRFVYTDLLSGTYSINAAEAPTVSPKLNILYNQSENLQFYIKTGKGFHSNDARGAVQQAVRETLPAAWGSDVGFLWKPYSKLFVNIAYWHLFLEQEFVYVGDAGIVEPSGSTRRQGIDLSLRYQPIAWLFWDLDMNYTLARTIDEPEGENYIPLAPDFTFMSGVKIIHPSGAYYAAKLRHIKNRPANEDNAIVAEGYTMVDMNVGYKWKNIDVSITIQNVFNTKWKETQFATASRLKGETESVEEIHFTPGTPFFIQGVVAYSF